MDIEQIEYIYRSRITLLDILEGRGYNVDAYRKFSPDEIAIAASSNMTALNFKVVKKDKEDEDCQVRYLSTNATSFKNLLDDFTEDNAPKEFILMTFTENLEKFHLIAAKQYLNTGMRVFCFNIPRIVNDPTKHILVPKHEIVPKEQHKDLLESMNIIEKKMLLHITSADPIVRCIGGLPGDIIRIERPSPSAGVYVAYRLVVP
jgi:DNA-directed RNA polymerase subunit H